MSTFQYHSVLVGIRGGCCCFVILLVLLVGAEVLLQTLQSRVEKTTSQVIRYFREFLYLRSSLVLDQMLFGCGTHPSSNLLPLGGQYRSEERTRDFKLVLLRYILDSSLDRRDASIAWCSKSRFEKFNHENPGNSSILKHCIQFLQNIHFINVVNDH